MKRIVVAFIYLLFCVLWGVLWGAAPPPAVVSVPVTVSVGTTTTAAFTIPKTVDKIIKAEIPCDPTWAIQIGIQFSTDKGATWDCDMAKNNCQGFGRPASPCLSQGKPLTAIKGTFSIAGTHPAKQSGTSVRAVFISNQAKTFTATLTFD